jgi:nucleoid-associated protein YgaU
MWNTLKKSLNSPDSYVSLALGFAVVLVVGMIAFNYFKGKGMVPGAQTQNKEEQATGAATLPAKHTVKAGETLWSISENYYKSGYNWVDLQKANNLVNADRVEAGQELTIPDVKPMTIEGSVSSAQTESKQYTVVSGDSLWKIAVSQYQDGYRWPEIMRANKITNPNIIYSGTVLTLP